MTFKEKNREAHKFFILVIYRHYGFKDIFQTWFLKYYNKKEQYTDCDLHRDLTKVFYWKNKGVACSTGHYKTICRWLNKLTQDGWLNIKLKMNPVTNRTAICYRINKRKVKEEHLEEWQKEFMFLKLKGEV